MELIKKNNVIIARNKSRNVIEKHYRKIIETIRFHITCITTTKLPEYFRRPSMHLCCSNEENCVSLGHY